MLNAVFADEFIDGVASIYSDRVLRELDSRLNSIRTFPLIGSNNLRPSLSELYGEDILKFPLSPFVIVYRYKEKEGLVEFLALPYEKSIQ